MPLPSYELMKKYYPNLGADQVYQLIGGTVNALHLEKPGTYSNACALRMSRAFNYAGAPLIKSSKYYMEKGADGKNYIFKKNDMVTYIRDHYSTPDYMFTPSGKGIIRKQKIRNKTVQATFDSYDQAIAGLKGIIVFHVEGWNDATGHVTLFSDNNSGAINSKCEDYHCYFEQHQVGVHTKKIELWLLN